MEEVGDEDVRPPPQLGCLHVRGHGSFGGSMRGVMRRGPRGGDKEKSDGGQAAASPAALTDRTPPPNPPPPPPTGHCLFAQGDK